MYLKSLMEKLGGRKILCLMASENFSPSQRQGSGWGGGGVGVGSSPGHGSRGVRVEATGMAGDQEADGR